MAAVKSVLAAVLLLAVGCVDRDRVMNWLDVLIFYI
jgi:hypothetical protein